MRGNITRWPLSSRASSRGVAAVEFGLLLPLLVVIFAGVVEFGLMLYDKAMITNAAREGARAGIMLRNPRWSKADIETIATVYCRDRLISLSLMGGGPCAAVATVPNPIDSLNSELTVKVSYQYHGPITGLVALITGSPLILEPMASTVTMKYE